MFAILDPERDGVANEVVTVANGLKAPNGIALTPEGALLIAEQHRIIRLDQHRRATIVVPPGVLPDATLHGWRYAGLGPDGKLYVAVGAPCNICLRGSLAGSIIRLRPDGHDLQIFARGVRNSVGFDWHPLTGELFFTDNGGDNLGDRIPPDELNRAPAPGLHFGFPYVYGDDVPYPQFADQPAPQPTTPPALVFEAHAAALGIDFYTAPCSPRTTATTRWWRNMARGTVAIRSTTASCGCASRRPASPAASGSSSTAGSGRTAPSAAARSISRNCPTARC